MYYKSIKRKYIGILSDHVYSKLKEEGCLDSEGHLLPNINNLKKEKTMFGKKRNEEEKKPELVVLDEIQDVPEMPVPATAPVPLTPAVKKKQFELSDTDAEFLGSSQYTPEAWEVIGRKHGIDPSTREMLPNTNNRAFVAVPKKYGVDESVVNGNPILTTHNINARPIPAAQVSAELARRNLTIPASDETHEEEV